MSPPKSQAQTNKEARDNNTLVLYRLDNVEQALKDLTSKVDRQVLLQPKDLDQLKEYFKELVTGIRTDLQKQIDRKADSDQIDSLNSKVEDLRSFVKAVGGFLSAVIGALVIYYITNKS